MDLVKYIAQIVSTTYCSLKDVSLRDTALAMGKLARKYIARTGKGRGASKMPGSQVNCWLNLLYDHLHQPHMRKH